MNELERILKALANKRRLAILKYLKGGRRAAVGDIAEEIGLSFKSTSRHLSILTGAGVLKKEQEALTMWHELSLPRHVVVSKVLDFL